VATVEPLTVTVAPATGWLSGAMTLPDTVLDCAETIVVANSNKQHDSHNLTVSFEGMLNRFLGCVKENSKIEQY
jgi:hypothetical protein